MSHVPFCSAGLHSEKPIIMRLVWPPRLSEASRLTGITFGIASSNFCERACVQFKEDYTSVVVDATTEWWTVECGGVPMCDVECCVKNGSGPGCRIGCDHSQIWSNDVAIMQAVEYVKCVSCQ